MTSAVDLPARPPDPALEVETIRAALNAGVGEAFRREAAARRRPPHRLSMSGLGQCTQAAAHAVAGTPVDDPPPPVGEDRPAALGTWIHAGLLPRLVEVFGDAVAEAPVMLRVGDVEVDSDLPGRIRRVTGSTDLVVVLLFPSGLVLVVVDVKTTGPYKLAYVRRRGMYPRHAIQVDGYTTAVMQAGRPVRHVAVIYLDRASGESEAIVHPFTNGRALGVLHRVTEIQAWAELGPDRAPRTDVAGRRLRGPGLDLECDGCWWLSRCWPGAERGQVGAQAVLARTVPGVEEAAALLADARDRAAAAERDRKMAAAVLAQVEPGLYGGWKVRRQPGTTRPDQKAMVADLERRGQPVPMMTTASWVDVAPVTLLDQQAGPTDLTEADLDETAGRS